MQLKKMQSFKQLPPETNCFRESIQRKILLYLTVKKKQEVIKKINNIQATK